MARGNTSEAINLSRLMSVLIFFCWFLLTVGWQASFGVINLSFTGIWEMSDSDFFKWAANFCKFAAPFVIVILIWDTLYKLKRKKLVGKMIYVSQHVAISLFIFVYCLVTMYFANRSDEDVYFFTNWIMSSFGTKLLDTLKVISMFYALIIIIFPPRSKGR